MSSPEVLVIGGGLIGSAIAWRLATAGRSVRVVAGEAEAAASRVAAGMLAPVTETTFTERVLLDLNLASMARFPSFAEQVSEASGLPSGLQTTPTLSVGVTPDDAARLTSLADYLERLGLESQRLTSREAKAYEPLLAPSIRSGLLVPGDWSCDNRLLWQALRTAGEHAGVVREPGFVHEVTSVADRATGVVLADGTTVSADVVVLANGAWAGQVTGIPRVPVRPVKGQILRLDPGRMTPPSVTVRAFTDGTEIYLVPRATGREVVVGATVEEQGFDRRVTAGGVYELLRDARRVLPMTAEYGLSETSVGWRPGTPDNAPILGPCELEGLLLATGHYRNGVLLTPVTAEVIAACVIDGALPEVAGAFRLARFDVAPRPSSERSDPRRARRTDEADTVFVGPRGTTSVSVADRAANGQT